MIDFLQPYTTQDLIHDSACIVDLSFIKRDKSYFLSRVQYWKNVFRENGYKTITISSNPSIDTIAMLFACAELGVLIETSNLDDGAEAFLRRTKTSEICYVGKHFSSSWFDYRNIQSGPLAHKPIQVLDEKAVTKFMESNHLEYIPEVINTANDLICGEVTGVPNSRVVHTSGPFMYGGKLSADLYTPEDTFGSTNGVAHIGLTTQTVLGPLFAGATLYTINNFYDLVFMAGRNLFTKLFFYDIHLKLTEWHPNFSFQPGALKGTTVFTAGNLPSPHFLDIVFGLDAKKIITGFGTNAAASPLFMMEINNKQFDVYQSGIGQLRDEIQVKIIDNRLWVKTPSQTVHVATDANGYFDTGDYIKQEGNKFFFMGKGITQLPSGNRVFSVQLQDYIQSVSNGDMFYSEFMLETPNATDTEINIYPLSLRAHDIISDATDRIKVLLQDKLENPGLEKINVHKVPNDVNLFAGRIHLGRVKQLIAEGKTL